MITEEKKAHHLNLHRFPKTWMVATIAIVSVCLVISGVYLTKAYHTKHQTKASVATKTNSATVKATTPVTAAPATTVAPKAAVVQASQDLKAIDLAGLKSSISEVKATLSAFSK